MKIKTNDEEMEIFIRHERYKDNIGRIKPNGGRTVAWIYEDDNKNVALSSVAVCSKRDTYNKKLGRRIAIGRLLKALGKDTKYYK